MTDKKPLAVSVPLVLEYDLVASLLESTCRTAHALNAYVREYEPADTPNDKELWEKHGDKAPSDCFAEMLLDGGGLLLKFYDEDEKPRMLTLEIFMEGVGKYLGYQLQNGLEVTGPEGWDAMHTATAIEFGLFGEERFN